MVMMDKFRYNCNETIREQMFQDLELIQPKQHANTDTIRLKWTHNSTQIHIQTNFLLKPIFILQPVLTGGVRRNV